MGRCNRMKQVSDLMVRIQIRVKVKLSHVTTTHNHIQQNVSQQASI